jgi:hypothetical protein
MCGSSCHLSDILALPTRHSCGCLVLRPTIAAAGTSASWEAFVGVPNELPVWRARQLDEPLHRWVVWADEAELERLQQYHQRAIGDDFRHRWTDGSLAKPSS